VLFPELLPTRFCSSGYGLLKVTIGFGVTAEFGHISDLLPVCRSTESAFTGF
jgi:hypothetical protein